MNKFVLNLFIYLLVHLSLLFWFFIDDYVYRFILITSLLILFDNAFILCNFQCTIAWTEFFWTLAHCQRLHADSRIRKQLINSSLRLQLNDSLNCCKVLRLRPGMFGFLFEWNLFGLAELYIRVWILTYSSHSLQVLRPCELRSLALAPLYRKIP